MKLHELKQKGAIVDMAMVKKDVEWVHKDDASGEKVTDKFSVFVIRTPFGVIESIMQNKEDGFSRSAALIAQCVRFGDEGEESMEYAEAFQLQPSLATALLEVVNAVNRGEIKNSKPTPSDGTNL
jgi:hypothetical protein